MALYHTAEHLDPSVLNQNDSDVKRWMEKRNVLGFFDGRPIKVLPANPFGHGVGLPDHMMGYGGFNFLANHRGALMLFSAGAAVAFDVSLEVEEFDPGIFGAPLDSGRFALRTGGNTAAFLATAPKNAARNTRVSKNTVKGG